MQFKMSIGVSRESEKMSRHAKHRVISGSSTIGNFVLLYCRDCGTFLEGYFDEWNETHPQEKWVKKAKT
jgi:hypothetical protein